MVQDDPILKFVCPLCGASCGEQCHVQIGVVRPESHSERWELAHDELLNSIAEGNAVAFMNEQRSSGKWQTS
jgi:anaerobic selenocysteine-containing dehydrogenase